VLGPYNAKDPALARLFDGGPVASGVPVNEWNALSYSAVWSAVGQISSTVASLPLKLYKRLPDGGKEPFAGHKLYELLHDNPNPEMTSFIFREILQAHLLTWGNAYAEIERDGAGRPVAIWPIPPDRVDPVRDARDRLVYRVRGDRLGDIIIPAADMLHVPGLGFDGIKGYGVVQMARESIGLGLAAERFGGTFFGNGSTFGGFLSHPAKLSPEARQNLQESLAKHAGPTKAHRILLLQENMSFIERKGIPPNDAQFLETRLFQVQEVARWLRISPYKLGDLSRATFSNIEHQAIEYYTDTIRPWLVRWEQEINRKLIAPLERRQQFAEFVIEGALRGDVASRYSAYAVGRQWGWLSADDVRSLENMNPLPKGQGGIYLLPQNMVPADRIGEIIDKQVAPDPKPVAPQPPTGGPSEEQTNSLRHVVEMLEASIPTLRAECDEARMDLAAARAAQAFSDGTSAELRSLIAAAEVRVVDADQVRAEALTALALANEQKDRLEARAAEAEREREALDLRRQGLEVALEAAVGGQERAARERDIAEAARAQAEALVVEAQAAAVAAQAERDAAAGESRAAADALSMSRTQLQARLATADAALAEAQAKLAAATEAEAARAAEVEQVAAQHREAVASVESLTVRLAGLNVACDQRDGLLANQAAEIAAAAAREAQQAAEARAASERQALVEAQLSGVVEDRDQAIAEARAAEAKLAAGRGALVSAHRSLYQDAMSRLVEREIDRIIGARSSANKLRTVMGPFYDRHLELVTRDLVPLLRVHLAFMRRDEDPATLAAELAEQHVAQSRADLAEVYEADADEFPTQLSRMIQRWRDKRTGDLAEYLMRREIEHG
jgi:HK97 family phage portal protein